MDNYAEAKARIEDVRQRSLPSLDLSGLGLTTLPPEIASLDTLYRLKLDDNRLTTLPPEIASLKTLIVLNATDNELTALPPEIASLTALKAIFVNGNHLAALPPEIAFLTKLEVLYLNDNHFTMLPPEIASLTALDTLSLFNNQLTELPAGIGALKVLRRLGVGMNRLTNLRPEIAALTELKDLNLAINRLTSLPPEIAALSQLESLDLALNQLGRVPPEIASLTGLKHLDLSHNQLRVVSAEIAALTELNNLDLSRNELSTLPAEMAALTELKDLDLSHNQFTTLPQPVLVSLKKLRVLAVAGNPLPAELLKLSGGRSGKGVKLIKFIRHIGREKTPARLKRFDEAKLLLLGSGEVGKTWLLKALQGKIPEKVNSTKGIEIAREPLELPHPTDSQRLLHLNCWDFGGQDYYQVTHQIFFSAKAVYLLVWKPRIGFDPNLVERLERIRLSAGRTAKVLVVSTHADGNVPASIGEATLREQFGELIGGFYEIDSLKGPAGTGIANLRSAIADAVAQLEGLDQLYPDAWHKARAAVLRLGRKTIRFSEFVSLCKKAGLDEAFAAPCAEIMEIQGKAVYFADALLESDLDFDGDNLVVLDPEWLAKAIGFVIEDKLTTQASGVLLHERLKTIWARNDKKDCPGYDITMHGYLLWLMWKFDIAYRQDAQTSLVPQLISRNRPDDLYWTPSTPSATREAALIGRIPHNPPVGLIPALTAAVHPLRRVRDTQATDRLDRNWREGFFLDTSLRGTAFVELRDRDLLLVVRDGYPSNLIREVQKTLEEIVRERWPRMEIDFRVPCIGKRSGKTCKGSHRRSWLESQRGQSVACEDCGERDLDVNAMLEGFDAREAAVMAQLRELTYGQQNILASAHAIFRSVDPENQERTRAPSMFTIFPDKGGWFQGLTHDSVRLTCWCEHPDGPHPASTIGSDKAPDYLLKMPKEWLIKCAPYISWTALLIKAFTPLVGTGVGQIDHTLRDRMALMSEISKALPPGTLELDKRADIESGLRQRPELVALRHLHDFMLEKVKPAQRWGDLRAVQTKSGDILWLCEQHAAIQQPPVEQI